MFARKTLVLINKKAVLERRKICVDWGVEVLIIEK